MSLRSIIRKGRFYNDWPREPESQSDYTNLAHYAMNALASPDTILVNVQSVLDDMMPVQATLPEVDAVWEKALNFAKIPRPTPPYEWMWLEGIIKPLSQQQVGMLVHRIPFHDGIGGVRDEQLRQRVKGDNPDMIVNAAVFHDYEGSAAFTGSVCYWLDKEGNFLSSFRQYPKLFEDERTQQAQLLRLKLREGWMLESFARMNCKNVELRPINEGKYKSHAPKKLVPASVWHEIVITSAPKIHSAGRDTFEHDKQEIRAHWIRGHYADYRRGKGLFGNPKLKGLYWIPEHRQGNEEIGQVIPEYTIQ